MEKTPRDAADHRSALTRRDLIGRTTFGVVGLSAAGTLLSACGSDDPGTSAGGLPDRPYKIGFVAPVTGPLAPEGVALQRGFELGVADLNAGGGINGHPVEFVFQDSKSNPSVDATIAKKMIQQDRVDALFGGVSGDEETVLRQIAKQSDVPFFFPENGTKGPECDTNVFLAESISQMLDELIPFLTKRYGTRWAMVGNDYVFPHNYLGVAKGLLADEGATVVSEQYAPLGTADYSSVVSKLKAADPDVVLTCVVGGDAIAFVKQATSLGLLPAVPITGVSLQPEFYPAMGGAIDGLYTAARYSESIDTEANRKFTAAYHERHGADPVPGVASSAYIGLTVVKTAVEKAGSYDGAAVYRATDGLKVRTLLSDEPLTLGSNRIFDFPMYVVQVKPGGKFEPVGPPKLLPGPGSC